MRTNVRSLVADQVMRAWRAGFDAGLDTADSEHEESLDAIADEGCDPAPADDADEFVDALAATRPADWRNGVSARVDAAIADERRRLIALMSDALGISCQDDLDDLITSGRLARDNVQAMQEAVAAARREKDAAIAHAEQLVDQKWTLRAQLEAIAAAATLGDLVKLAGGLVDGDRVPRLGSGWFPVATMADPSARPFTAQELEAIALACEAQAPNGGPIAWFSLRDRARRFAAMLKEG